MRFCGFEVRVSVLNVQHCYRWVADLRTADTIMVELLLPWRMDRHHFRRLSFMFLLTLASTGEFSLHFYLQNIDNHNA